MPLPFEELSFCDDCANWYVHAGMCRCALMSGPCTDVYVCMCVFVYKVCPSVSVA